MEMLSAFLALREGNPPVTGGVPSQKVSNAKLYVVFFVSLKKLLTWPNSLIINDSSLEILSDILNGTIWSTKRLFEATGSQRNHID